MIAKFVLDTVEVKSLYHFARADQKVKWTSNVGGLRNEQYFGLVRHTIGARVLGTFTPHI